MKQQTSQQLLAKYSTYYRDCLEQIYTELLAEDLSTYYHYSNRIRRFYARRELQNVNTN